MKKSDKTIYYINHVILKLVLFSFPLKETKTQE